MLELTNPAAMDRGESSASDSTDPSKWKYDVFLSFAGEDTRLNFTDHLYEAFIRSGITCFRDDIDLERGGNIKDDLSQAIKDSLCAVVVISENYAASTWCMEELQMILESQKTLNQKVFPVFYGVDPADVRKQRNSFATEVQNWKNALFEISNLSGWDTRNKHQAEVIKNIVEDVWTDLSFKLPSYHDDLIGVDLKVVDLISSMEIGLNDKRFVGIWGMGGAGKTTLARVVFEKISYKFEVCCFLANVRETLLQREGLVSLQKRLLSHLNIKTEKIYDDYEGMKNIRKLLCNKKVLLVLDDLDDTSQLKNLAQSSDWFGKGSRIIITTRDNQLLTIAGVGQRMFEMKTMNTDESLQLFSNKAVHKDHPKENFLELSKSVVKYTGGLPLALETLGSFLHGRSEVEWRDALDRLKRIPNKNILQVLKISYDGLNEEEKTIFLDIACFFKGWRKKKVTRILKGCDLHATIGIKILIEKTLLIETEDGTLEMHDLLEEMGRYIVHEQSLINGGRHSSRLWKYEEVKEVLENNRGSEAIEAIVIKDFWGRGEKIKVHPEAFSMMSNLRLLCVGRFSSIIFPREMKPFTGALKFVQWEDFPFNTFPLGPSSELVHIQMYKSKIEHLDGIQFMRKLKFIDVSRSNCFAETPDFSRVPYLEHLYLRYCDSLVKVHPSLGKLKELAVVCLTCCLSLEFLPRKLETNSLIKLELPGCKKVAVLAEFGECMKRLSYLDVQGTAITCLPESFGFLTGLKVLKTHITRQIFGLNVMSLTELRLSACGLNDGSVLDAFGTLSSLVILDLSCNEFVELPAGCFSSCFRLLFLTLTSCKKLKSLPKLPPRLVRLRASNCDSMESPLSSDRELWNLVATLDHEHRGQTKYAIIDKKDEGDMSSVLSNAMVTECILLLKHFCAFIQGSDIPSWFSNRQYYPVWDRFYKYQCEIEVSIPGDLRDREWSGIVVCCLLSNFEHGVIAWSIKSAEDDSYRHTNWGDYSFIRDDIGMCIMVLELNEETCWQHLRGHNKSLHIMFSVNSQFDWERYNGAIKGCGWRVICKEEIQDWCNENDDFNQLTQPQLASHHDDIVELCSEGLQCFFGNTNY